MTETFQLTIRYTNRRKSVEKIKAGDDNYEEIVDAILYALSAPEVTSFSVRILNRNDTSIIKHKGGTT